MEPPDPAMILCPHCGAENPPDAKTCASCGRLLVHFVGFDEPPAPPIDREEAARRTVHLSTLMLLIAVIAVCLGVLRELPGLGILLALLVLPALARTFAGAARRQARGHAMSWDEKMLTFLGSLGIVAGIGASAIIAFVITCFPTGMVMFSAGSSAGLIFAVLAGLTAAGFMIYFLARQLWPQKDS